MMTFVMQSTMMKWESLRKGIIAESRTFSNISFFRLAVCVGNGKYELYKESSNIDIGKAVGGVYVTKNLTGPHYSIVGKADLVNIHSGKTNIETVDFNILGAEAKAEIRFEDIDND